MKNIIENFVYNLAYQILMIVIPFITMPYLTRVLGSDAIGINSYTNSVILLFTTFGLLGLTNYSSREIAYSSAKGREALSKSFISLCVIRLFLLILCLFCYMVMLHFSEYGYYFILQLFMLLYYFIDISWLFIGIENMRIVVIRNTVVKIVSTIMIFLFVKESSDLALYIVINGGSALLGACVIFGQVRKYVHWVRISRKDITRHIVPIIKLFLPQAASSLYYLFDKTMIKWLTDNVRIVGFYDQSQMISKVPIVFVSSLTTVMLPRISNVYCKGELERVKEYLAHAISFVIIFAYPFWLGLAGIAPVLIPWYLGEQFLECTQLLQLFSLTIIPIYFTNVTGIMYLMALDKTKELTISYTLAACTNLLINVLLIPGLGAYGAVFGTICAECIVFLVQYHYMKNEMGSMHLFQKSIKSILASAVMYCVVWHIGEKMGVGAEVTALQIVAGGIVYLLLMCFLKGGWMKLAGYIKNACPKS